MDYDDFAYSICQALIRILASDSFHDMVVERLRKEIEGDEVSEVHRE